MLSAAAFLATSTGARAEGLSSRRASRGQGYASLPAGTLLVPVAPAIRKGLVRRSEGPTEALLYLLASAFRLDGKVSIQGNLLARGEGRRGAKGTLLLVGRRREKGDGREAPRVSEDSVGR